MKILQVIQRFPPAVGGGEEVVFQLSKALVDRGHKVTVATSNWKYDNDIPGLSSSRINLRFPRHHLLSEEMMDGIEIRRFKPWFRFLSYTLNPSLAAFLLRYADNYDIIHAHYYMFTESDLAALASIAKNRPFILTHHRSLGTIDSLGSAYRVAHYAYDKTIGKITLNSVDRLIVLTEGMKQEFELMGIPSKKLRVVPNGVAFDRFKPKELINETLLKKIGEPGKIVLFVGRLEKAKGPQHVIEAAPKILAEFPDTKFIFVGEDWGYGSHLRKLAEELSISENLIFAGRVNDEELVGFYNIANVLVFPSIGEGFGMVAVESIACGTPTILANSDGLKDILGQIGGYGLDMERDVAVQIAKSVVEVFSNPNIKEEMAIQRQRLKERFSWDAIAQTTENVYLEAMEG